MTRPVLVQGDSGSDVTYMQTLLPRTDEGFVDVVDFNPRKPTPDVRSLQRARAILDADDIV